MIFTNRLLPCSLCGLLIVFLLAACGKTASPDAPGGGDPVNPGGPYVMLFPDGPEHGLPSGHPLSALIALDLSEHTKTYPWPDRTFTRMAFEVAPNVFTVEERGGGCKESDVEFYSTQELPPGQPAHVDFLDVVMTSSSGPGPWATSPELSPSSPAGLPGPNQMCFGVRSPGGGWTWSLEPKTSTWDAAAQRFRTRFTMGGAAIDAFKIMFTSGGGFKRSIVEIAITATPVAP